MTDPKVDLVKKLELMTPEKIKLDFRVCFLQTPKMTREDKLETLNLALTNAETIQGLADDIREELCRRIKELKSHA